MDSAFDLAADLNNRQHDKHHDRKGDGHSDGIYSSKSYDRISERQDESGDVIFKNGKNKKGDKHRERSREPEDPKKRHKDTSKRRKEMTFADRVKPEDSDDDGKSYDLDSSTEERHRRRQSGKHSRKTASDNVSAVTGNDVAEDNRPYTKVKHAFEIQVKELKNIPILDKLIKDVAAHENAKTLHSRQ